MIADAFNQWEHYFSGAAWQCACRFLQSLNLDAEDGETPLQGDDIIARVMSYETRSPQEAALEAHRDYVDIQMVLRGAEGIDWFPREGLDIRTPYDDAKDVEFYHRPGVAPIHIDNHPGNFVVLFPDDAHMPQLMVGGAPATIKKVVVKVKLDLVRNSQR